jgi:hypothetical protein
MSLLSAVGFAIALAACSGSPGPQGAAGPQGAQGPAGLQGVPGEPGTDGQLRIYGDGSAGSFTVSVSTNWGTAAPADQNLQFEDFTINSAVTLIVPSGTMIRARGTFTNNGTLTVTPYANGGEADLDNATAADAILAPPNPGISPGVAGFGERAVGASANCDRGKGGIGIGSGLGAAAILNPGPLGGGGGAGATNSTTAGSGGDGGGVLVVLAQGSIDNSGTIRALGQSTLSLGGGGGGGGVIILASKTSITHSGTINANGGAGGPSGASTGAGGGGGGGIVQLIAPTVTSTAGTINVAGGLPGTQGAVGSATGTGNRMGGGGGGGSGGNGGGGGTLVGNNPGVAVSGGAGFPLIRRFDPTALF